MSYKFKWKRFFLTHSVMVTGHRYDETQDKMCLFFEDGGLKEIKKWKGCEVTLGSDWALAVKKEMERQAGQSIPVNIKA